MSNDVSSFFGRRCVFANPAELYAFVQFADYSCQDGLERMLASLIGPVPACMVRDVRNTVGLLEHVIRPRCFFEDLLDLLDGKWEICHAGVQSV